MKKQETFKTVYKKKPYKFDRLMQEAAKRSANHPKLVAITSNVPEYSKLWSKK